MSIRDWTWDDPIDWTTDETTDAAGSDWHTYSTWNVKFDELPPCILARVGAYVMGVPVAQVEEVRACNCLNPGRKPFPFRGGATTFLHDTETKMDIRRDLEKCRLDVGSGLGPWCLKHDLARRLGRKHLIANFAATNKTMYKKWRDVTAYVFCCESCMNIAILKQPLGNKRMMTRVRFYERFSDMDIEGLSREAYAKGDRGTWEDFLVYETNGNQEVEYKGFKVWVKELVLTSDDI
ncbi:uncharacterized protein HMPREF1541_04605 [Cyphellophora europaea CBS 101466]|uniref:Uncharacterized protein n=1 Tax=Cyphellophora europaea (strain CBS 101466) TaxID=1220924 RepID=W2RX98_CYPE1|nr:uncharacterized protein HMPREF1541_04605 [Cyphellophora europaea CBS 101466]ETN40329.1 hypothetical protein HMPREF1541_04605 [Cyphellophora europaea CBS 101466]